MKKLHILLGFVFVIYNLSAQSAIIVSDIGSNTVWSCDTTYFLKNVIRVKNNATLTIQPGTTIKGSAMAPFGALVITRGSKIIADGTLQHPIIFTSDSSDLIDSHWGGLHLLGKAPTNCFGLAQFCYDIVGGGVEPDSIYGGTSPNDTSGILRYVIIEGGGRNYEPVEASNRGLSLAGVGDGTILEFVKVSHSEGDGIGFYGGTVNARYLFLQNNFDEDLDFILGYTGKIQFVYALRNSASTWTNSYAIDSQNDQAGTQNEPFTKAVISNLTVLLPDNAPSSNYKQAIFLRRNSKTSIFNAAVIGKFTGGVRLSNQNDSTEFKHVFLGGPTTAAADLPSTIWFYTPGWGNQWFADANNLGTPNWLLGNPLPAINSLLAGGASFSISPQLQDPFFEPVPYAGAFWDIDWTLGWASGTNINCQALSTHFLKSEETWQIFPNPILEGFWIKNKALSSCEFQFQLMDLSGKMMQEGKTNYPAVFIERGNLPAGFYFLRLTANTLNKQQVIKLTFE